MEEFEFFVEFLLVGVEVFAVGRSEVGQDADLRTDHCFEALHFAGTRNAGLDHHQLLVAADHQQRQGHAELRIVAARAAEEAARTFGPKLGDPLFNDRFAVAAGHSDHRTVVLVPMIGGQRLQCGERIGHGHERSAGQRLGRMKRHTSHQETADTAPVQIGDIVVSVVAGTGQGDEQCFVGPCDMVPTVRGNGRHPPVVAMKGAARDGGYLG